ncbi:doublesex- and mab-3-related transcription factor C1-like [Thomomys bottae]
MCAFKTDQGSKQKRPLAIKPKNTMVPAASSNMQVQTQAVPPRVQTRRNNVSPCRIQPYIITTQEENSQSPVLLALTSIPSPVIFVPGTTGSHQLSISISGNFRSAPYVQPIICSNMILCPCITSEPPTLEPLQPQIPNTSNQVPNPDAEEWQQILEAAEALMTLKNSSWIPAQSSSQN